MIIRITLITNCVRGYHKGISWGRSLVFRISCHYYYHHSYSMYDEKENIKNNISVVKQNIEIISPKARLVAVSKTKSPPLIEAAYSIGHRHFGENYAQEIMEKAPLLPSDIQWHFIGHLQSNKVNKLLSTVKNLWAVETVDSPKLANVLSKAVIQNNHDPLNIFIQVNTSGEAQKSGISPQEAVKLAKEIYENTNKKYDGLILKGLMTIGKLEGDASVDFQCLVDCRKEVADALGIDTSKLELSMGMSHDYELAARMGSTNIRVGSTIFGPKVYTKEQNQGKSLLGNSLKLSEL